MNTPYKVYIIARMIKLILRPFERTYTNKSTMVFRGLAEMLSKWHLQHYS
jgi:hypothetical protein